MPRPCSVGAAVLGQYRDPMGAVSPGPGHCPRNDIEPVPPPHRPGEDAARAHRIGMSMARVRTWSKVSGDATSPAA